MGGVRDGFSNFEFFEAVAPQSFIGTSVTGATVDKQGYQTLTFVITVGEISGAASATASVLSCGFFRMQHGTSNDAGTVVWSACDQSDILVDNRLSGTTLNTSGYASASMGILAVSNAGSGMGNGTFLCIGGVSADKQSFWESQVHAAGYHGDHRWVRVLVSQSGTDDMSATAIQAIAVLGNPANWPVNTVRYTG